MSAEAVTRANCVRGASVIRGPGWCFGDQDTRNNGDGVGTIVELRFDGWVRVDWHNGNKNIYPAYDQCLLYEDVAVVEELRHKEDERYALEPL